MDLPSHGYPPTSGGQVALAFLAGGRSRRMGHDKAFAELAGQTLIERLRDRVATAFPHVFIVTKDPTRFRDLGLPVVVDARSEDSPTVGVYSAVLAAPTPRVLCLGVDLPFVTRELLVRLVELSEGHEAFVPRDGSGLQPLCAVYDRQTLPALERMLDQDERRLDLIFERVQTGYLDVRSGDLGDPGVLFLNVNTQTDLERARLVEQGAAVMPAGTGDEAGVGTVAPSTGAGAAGRASTADATPAALPPAPRVVDFVRRVPLPTVSVVGKKKSGKTTLLVGVIAELVRRGRRVAAIKSDQHGFSIDVPGTDSHALREAGADVTAVSSPQYVAVMSRVPQAVPLLGLVRRLREPLDVVLTEGFARQPAPKIEVSRAARSDTLITPPDELLAIVGDQEFPDYPVPQIGLDDYAAVADLIEAQMTAQRAAREATPGDRADGQRQSDETTEETRPDPAGGRGERQMPPDHREAR